MDTQTRHSLKKDSFVEATASSVSWMNLHRSGVIGWAIAAVVVIALCIGGLTFWNYRTAQAESALGDALDTYNAQILPPGAPAMNGAFTTADQKTQAANQKFLAVAQQYGMFPEGTKAHYFAGVTYMDMGKTAEAEKELKDAAGSWNGDLSSLANLALAGLYHQTSRDNDAIDMYKKLAAKPSATVSAFTAKMRLADLYDSNGKQDEARKIWAEVKDADKDGAAGSIAAQKLAPKDQQQQPMM